MFCLLKVLIFVFQAICVHQLHKFVFFSHFEVFELVVVIGTSSAYVVIMMLLTGGRDIGDMLILERMGVPTPL